MAGPSWLLDKPTIASIIKYSNGAEEVNRSSDPAIACPNCQHVIHNSDVAQEWPGLPKGVKFDPSDQEIMAHLLAKVGEGNSKPHPFIDEFITTLDEDFGVCYTHPQLLPGVSKDRIASYFFHRVTKAFNTGSRKRRKICCRDFGNFRWHITGKTRPIFVNGVRKGCKKVMVLYTTNEDGRKSEKTNWVNHQYHVGTEEHEKEGDLVISKIIYQKQECSGEKYEQNVSQTTEETVVNASDVTVNSSILEPILNANQFSGHNLDQGLEPHHIPQIPSNLRSLDYIDILMEENNIDKDFNWLDDSQNVINSHHHVESSPLLENFFQSPSPKRDGEPKEQLSHSADDHLSEQLMKDIEEWENLSLDTTKKNNVKECQNHNLDTAEKNNIEEWHNFAFHTANAELDSPFEF